MGQSREVYEVPSHADRVSVDARPQDFMISGKVDAAMSHAGCGTRTGRGRLSRAERDPFPSRGARVTRSVPPYRVSSRLYDRMVGEVLHQAWRENFERLERRYSPRLDLVADVACGTGLASRYLAERGCRVLAVDISPEILAQAAARLRGRPEVILLRQDMRYLSLPRRVPTMICANDSLNHLLEEEDLRQALASFHAALEEGGHLFFDLNTAYQLREGRDEEEWTFHIEGWRLAWRSEWDERTAKAALTMRLERTEGEEGPWVEVHRERAYSQELVVSLLEKVGFHRVDVWDAAGLGKPGLRTRRLQFVAIKKGMPYLKGRPQGLSGEESAGLEGIPKGEDPR